MQKQKRGQLFLYYIRMYRKHKTCMIVATRKNEMISTSMTSHQNTTDFLTASTKTTIFHQGMKHVP